MKVRAILSWNTQPQPNNPNYSPIWGSVMDVMVQIRPRFFIDFGELVTEVLKPVPIPDPIGPVIKQIDPKIKLPLALSPTMAFAEKKELYLQNRVPMHRVAFPEVQHLLTAKSVTATQIKTSPLISLGLTEAEIGDLLGKLQAVTDGDTSFEELKCVGIRPEKDMLEAVFTMNKKFGYSGSLCTEGSTEYVAFWIDFNDGGGFTYIDTAALEVHDLTEVGADGSSVRRLRQEGSVQPLDALRSRRTNRAPARDSVLAGAAAAGQSELGADLGQSRGMPDSTPARRRQARDHPRSR